MARYIDADEAWMDAEDRGFEFWTSHTDIENVQRFLEQQTTVYAEPVRHGKWEKVNDKYPRYVCTMCNHLFNNKGYKFCPNCGAKMDKRS